MSRKLPSEQNNDAACARAAHLHFFSRGHTSPARSEPSFDTFKSTEIRLDNTLMLLVCLNYASDQRSNCRNENCQNTALLAKIMSGYKISVDFQ